MLNFFSAGILVIIGLIIVFLNFHPAFGKRPSGRELKRIEESEFYYGGSFKNLDKKPVITKIRFSTILKFFSSDGNPDGDIPVEKIKLSEFVDSNNIENRVTWFGHSTIFLELGARRIFIDPMLSDVPAPHPYLGSKRFSRDLPLEINDIPEIDLVLISHDHYDHLDYGSIRKIKDKVKMFFVPLGVSAHLIKWGVEEEKITEFEWYEEKQFFGLKIISVPAKHFSGRSLLGRNKTLWTSWIINGNGVKLFFSGDTGYHQEFKKIGEKYGPFDLTMMECGQYNEDWREIHMLPEESVEAHLDLRGRYLLPIHWGAFKLSVHSWQEPAERILKEAEKQGVKVITPRIGETFSLKDNLFSKKWWEDI